MAHRADAVDTDSSFVHPLLLPLHMVIIALSLWVPPFPGRRELSAVLIVASYIPTIRGPVCDNPHLAYGVASLWGMTIRALTIHLLSDPDPERALYRIARTKKGGDRSGAHIEEVHAYGMGWRKLEWICSLMLSPRGGGWNYQIQMAAPSLQPTHASRRAFAKYLFKRLLMLYVILDACRTFDYMDPKRFMSPELDEQFWTWSNPYNITIAAVFEATVHGFAARYCIDLNYTVFSALCVFIGGQHPSEWPPLFGSLADIYRLSYFWGRVWHQLLRTMIAPWGDAVCRVLGVKNKTLVMLSRVIMGSFLSGVGHAAAVYAVTRGRYGWDSLWYFSVQAVGIIFEVAVCEMYRRLTGGNSKRTEKTEGKEKGKQRDSSGLSWGKVVGYIWVAAWLFYTGQWMWTDVRRANMGTMEPVPWSVFRWALGWPQSTKEIIAQGYVRQSG